MADAELAPLAAPAPVLETLAAPPPLAERLENAAGHLGAAVKDIVHPAPEPVTAVALAAEAPAGSHLEALQRERGLTTGEAIASAAAAVEAASHALRVAARSAAQGEEQGRGAA